MLKKSRYLKKLNPISLNKEDILCVIDIGNYDTRVSFIKFDLIKNDFEVLETTREVFDKDIKDVYSSIFIAIDKMEKILSVKVDKVVLLINVKYLKINHIEINEEFSSNIELDYFNSLQIIHNAINEYAINNETEVIIDYFNDHYVVGDKIKVKDLVVPIENNKLSAKLLLLSINKSVFSKFNNSLKSYNLNIVHCVPSICSAAIAISASSRDKLERLIINLGYSETSFAVVEDGNIKNIGYLTNAGLHITKAIAKQFAISLEDAEIIKKQIDCNKTDNIKNLAIGLLDEEIKDLNISSVEAQTCVIEILEKIFQDIYETIDIRDIHEIVLVGGTSKMTGIDKIAKNIFKINTSCNPELASVNAIGYYILEKSKYEKKIKKSFLNNLLVKISCFLDKIF